MMILTLKSVGFAEGEDIMDVHLDEETTPSAPTALPIMPQTMHPEMHKTVTSTQSPIVTPSAATSFITQHISIQHKAHLQPPQPQLLSVSPSHPVSKPAVPPTPKATTSSSLSPTLIPTQTQMVSTSSLHPTVIAHASASHPSVIQAVNHVIQTGGPRHITHLASSTTTSSVQLAPGQQPIGHITVHPVAHLGQHLPTLYPQQVTQPALISHIAHTLNHAHTQLNGTAIVSKQTTMVAHHPQLVGQTVLNPVTMVTMPSLPISGLKLS